MRDFGAFLSNLRSSAGLSLEALAKIVGSSKSTLSRLENGEVPRPLRGPVRRLVICLGELLCSSQKEAERYLQLAGMNTGLLTESEKVQLGETPQISIGAVDEVARLERLEQVYTQLLKHWEDRELALGISEAPQLLKRKTQVYTNALAEVQNRLTKLTGREGAQATSGQQSIQQVIVHHMPTLEGRIVVGHQHGEQFAVDPTRFDLHLLASPNARWLMQLADIECFAVDDCIILTNSRDFRGWSPQDIQTTLVSVPLPMPYDLEQLREEKVALIERDYTNNAHYRLVSFTPSFNHPDLLRVTLSPIGFFDYYSLSPFFDEPLLTALDGSKVSIRQKYGNTALTYISTERGVSLIPAPLIIGCFLPASLVCVIRGNDECASRCAWAKD